MQTAQSPDDVPSPEATRTERVGLETATHLIRATVTLPLHGYRSRFSDYLNRTDVDYLALTDAERIPLDGDTAAKHSFLAVAREAVLYGYPLEDEEAKPGI